MINKEDTYRIGRITKTHALKGEVAMEITDDAFAYNDDCDYLICEIDEILVPFFIEAFRFKSDTTVLMKFYDIDFAEQARNLVGSEVYCDKKFASADEDGNVSLEYFVGFTMQDSETGDVIGKIVDIDDNTENWLFVVERPDGSELLVPTQEEFIDELMMEDKIMTMCLPEGLLDL